MKLSAWRLKDQVHIQGMDASVLITLEIESRLPAELLARLRDVVIDDFFWYGWADLFPIGSTILMETACSPGGRVSEVRRTIRTLGPGRAFAGK